MTIIITVNGIFSSSPMNHRAFAKTFVLALYNDSFYFKVTIQKLVMRFW